MPRVNLAVITRFLGTADRMVVNDNVVRLIGFSGDVTTEHVPMEELEARLGAVGINANAVAPAVESSPEEQQGRTTETAIAVDSPSDASGVTTPHSSVRRMPPIAHYLPDESSEEEPEFSQQVLPPDEEMTKKKRGGRSGRRP